jgi:hypothetical protein
MNGTRAALAESVMAVPQSRIRELSDIAMSMEGVLKLYFGESNQPTPRYIKGNCLPGQKLTEPLLNSMAKRINVQEFL